MTSRAETLADEYRNTMPYEVLKLWGVEAAAELRRLAAEVEALKAVVETSVTKEQRRIKDGVMALTMTAENLSADAPDVDTARKALALRIITLIDGQEDLVLTEAGKAMLGMAKEFRAIASNANEVPPDPYHSGGGPDPLLEQARVLVIESQKGSISYIQRKLQIGYNRATRLLEDLEKLGVVSHLYTSGQRIVLVKESPHG